MKNNGLIAGLVILAIGLWGFKKKEPSVEVGQGEFGEFGTNGSLPVEDLEHIVAEKSLTQQPAPKAPLSIIPLVSTGLFIDDSQVRPVFRSERNEGLCTECQ